MIADGESGPEQDTTDLLPYDRRFGARPRLAEGLAAAGPERGGPGLDAGTVAVAGRDAVVQTTGARPLGGQNQSVQQPNSRVFIGTNEGVLVALHAFIKKTQRTPDSELAIARKRLKELAS